MSPMEAQEKTGSDVASRGGGLGSLKSLVRTMRPHQWIKNALVFLPFLFAVRVAWSPEALGPVPEIFLTLVVVFLAFCALASSTYLLNDLMDRDADRSHPVKRRRPIASGRVSVGLALAAMVVLAAAGLGVMAAVNPGLGAISLLYLGVNIAYCMGIKQVVLLDLFAVASGYVIRVTAGAVAIGVAPSPWLFVATGAGALFLVLGRRYAEVRLSGDSAAAQRSVMSKYRGPLIGQLLNISAAGAWLSYTLYTVEAENLPGNHTMLLTVPIVTFGLFRYLYLLNTNREAESPELLIARDLPMLASVVCWIVVSALVLVLNG